MQGNGKAVKLANPLDTQLVNVLPTLPAGFRGHTQKRAGVD